MDDAQREVVDYLDKKIDELRVSGTQHDWDASYDALMTGKRTISTIS